MAANMIGVRKNIIIVNVGVMNIVMFNPVIVKKDTPYETEEGGLSLTGVRQITRYQNIELEYYDSAWKKHRQKFSGWTAQICQHEIDHLSGRII
jgi:peptide deformylase